MKPINIIIAGVGGQGNLLASYVIAKAAVDQGFSVITSETFGASQRGGAVASHLRIAKEHLGPVIPEGQCDILIGFEPLEALRYVGRFMAPNGIAIVNDREIYPVNAIIGKVVYPGKEQALSLINKSCKTVYHFNATDLAISVGNALAMNMVMVGALVGSKEVPLTRDSILNALKASVRPHTMLMNLQAIDAGIKAIDTYVKP